MFMLDSVGVCLQRVVEVYGLEELDGGGGEGDMGKLNCIYIILYEYVILANAISLLFHSRRHRQRIYGP